MKGLFLPISTALLLTQRCIFSIAPTSYGDCFEILGKNKMIPKDMELSLKKMAGFRNFIIHRYGKIDFIEVYKIIGDSIVYINEFKQIIKNILEAQ